MMIQHLADPLGEVAPDAGVVGVYFHGQPDFDVRPHNRLPLYRTPSAATLSEADLATATIHKLQIAHYAGGIDAVRRHAALISPDDAFAQWLPPWEANSADWSPFFFCEMLARHGGVAQAARTHPRPGR